MWTLLSLTSLSLFELALLKGLAYTPATPAAKTLTPRISSPAGSPQGAMAFAIMENASLPLCRPESLLVDSGHPCSVDHDHVAVQSQRREPLVVLPFSRHRGSNIHDIAYDGRFGDKLHCRCRSCCIGYHRFLWKPNWSVQERSMKATQNTSRPGCIKHPGHINVW